MYTPTDTPQQTQPKPVCYYYSQRGSYIMEPNSASLGQFKIFLNSYKLTPGQGVTQEMMVQMIGDLGTAGWDIKLERPPTTVQLPVKPIEDIARQG